MMKFGTIISFCLIGLLSLQDIYYLEIKKIRKLQKKLRYYFECIRKSGDGFKRNIFLNILL